MKHTEMVFENVVSVTQVQALRVLAHTIWHEYYPPIIGEAQVVYMLEKFHSCDGITDQIHNQGFMYFKILHRDKAIGYIAVEPQQSVLFLSKFYLLKAYRGQGFGTESMRFLLSLAVRLGMTDITLTVNRDNDQAITTYQRMGFSISGELCVSIGEGYVMDDYTMQGSLASLRQRLG